MGNIEYSKKIGRYIPMLLLLISLIFAYLCLTYRHQDWITGGLLLSVCAPIIFIELIAILAFFLSAKVFVKKIFITIEIVLTIAIILFYIIYITKYN